jgi:uncharacterized protein (DUF1015 family)
VATVRAFVALRPPRELVDAVAAPPYDVVDTAEAAAIADGDPDSFLRVSRPEIALPATASPAEVHRFGRQVLEDFVDRGTLVRDRAPELLVYRQEMGDASQTGVVAVVTAADYRSGVIAVHEHTRPDKENDRTEHIAALAAHDEPVFLMYRPDAPGASRVAAVIAGVTAGEPEYLLERDGVRHTMWTVPGAADVEALEAAFADVPVLYVADGHHRSAAAARLAAGDDRAGAGVFPAVVFPSDELTIMAYNRVVRDLAGRTAAAFVAALGEVFDVAPASAAPVLARHQVGVYLDGAWWTATARPGVVDEADPIARLDVSVLQDRVLAPVLGIADPRTDTRIAFVGGIRGTAELERLVDSGEFAVAFALHPTAPDEVMDVADGGQVMPPKSTWFEPKLLSGLFVHPIEA